VTSDEEIERRRALGTDPLSGRYRSGEEEAAIRLETRVGILTRDPTGVGDWIDAHGRACDAVGPVPMAHFNEQAFVRQIDRHLLKHGVDFVVVDVTGLLDTQARAAMDHVAGLPDQQRQRIILQP
jgi:hypothetical protein